MILITSSSLPAVVVVFPSFVLLQQVKKRFCCAIRFAFDRSIDRSFLRPLRFKLATRLSTQCWFWKNQLIFFLFFFFFFRIFSIFLLSADLKEGDDWKTHTRNCSFLLLPHSPVRVCVCLSDFKKGLRFLRIGKFSLDSRLSSKVRSDQNWFKSSVDTPINTTTTTTITSQSRSSFRLNWILSFFTIAADRLCSQWTETHHSCRFTCSRFI